MFRSDEGFSLMISLTIEFLFVIFLVFEMKVLVILLVL